VSHAEAKHYQPSNITFGIMAPWDDAPGERPKKGADRKQAISARALAALGAWLSGRTVAAVPDIAELTGARG
jgi:folate-dependent tRNA-U54 methylase TrmFO/GidA